MFDLKHIFLEEMMLIYLAIGLGAAGMGPK
jgi:hypothetical protein